jgi:hypothetical protein
MNNMNEQQKSVIDRIRSGELEKPADINTQPEPVQKTDTKPTTSTDTDIPTSTTLTEKAKACLDHILSLPQFSKDKWKSIQKIAYRKIAGTAVLSQHASGNAIDWVGSTKLMQQLADYLVTNANMLHVKNVIYNKKIWNSPTGWHEYKGVHPHTDHVHVDFTTKDSKSTTNTNSTNWKKHDSVEKFGNDLLKFITTDAEKYFEKFKWTWTSWGDDEVKARAYFDKQITQAKTSYGINQAGFMKDLFPQTRHNLKELDDVIKYVGELITKGDQGSKTIKYYYYDKTEKKWKTQNVKFVWDYM